MHCTFLLCVIIIQELGANIILGHQHKQSHVRARRSLMSLDLEAVAENTNSKANGEEVDEEEEELRKHSNTMSTTASAAPLFAHMPTLDINTVIKTNLADPEQLQSQQDKHSLEGLLSPVPAGAVHIVGEDPQLQVHSIMVSPAFGPTSGGVWVQIMGAGSYHTPNSLQCKLDLVEQ
jgi:hypothetical protein